MNSKKIIVALSILAVLVAGSVASVGAQTPMHVGAFRLAFVSGQIKSSVQVLDGLNRPVPGAAVQVSFEKDGSPTILRTSLTGMYGWARAYATVRSGRWVVCVEEIHKVGYRYDPAQNLCKSIQVP